MIAYQLLTGRFPFEDEDRGLLLSSLDVLGKKHFSNKEVRRRARPIWSSSCVAPCGMHHVTDPAYSSAVKYVSKLRVIGASSGTVAELCRAGAWEDKGKGDEALWSLWILCNTDFPVFTQCPASVG